MPQIRHVFLLVLENREYRQAAAGVPYLTVLGHKGELGTRSYAIDHPSLPNYLALVGGQTFGISSDVTGITVQGPNLMNQLDHRRLSWGAYLEGLPRPCYRGPDLAGYVERHNPFAYFVRTEISGPPCPIYPLSQLYTQLRRNTVPRFTWITPNLCNDGHDCPDATVDRFLRRIVPRITSSAAYHDHGILIITYDEGTTTAGCCRKAAGGHVATVFLSDALQPGTVVSAPFDHYSVLRAIEDWFRVPRLANAGCSCTPSLRLAWRP